MALHAGQRAGGIRVTYRAGGGAVVDTTLDRLCADEVIAGLPVREFRWHEGRRHYSGWYWCATGQRLVVYESRLELARIMLADFDPAVTAVAAQPFRLIGRDGSRMRRHVPDVLLAGADCGVTVVDVKAPAKRADPEVRAVMEWTRQVAALRGWAFEEWYGARPRLLENVCFLAGYRRRGLVDDHLIPAVLAAAGEPSPVLEVEAAGPRRPSGAGPAGGDAPAVVRGPGHRHGTAAGRGQRDLAAGGSGSVSGAVVICPGSRFAFDGEVVEVTGFEGTRVTLRDARDRWRTLGLAGFLARAAPLEAPAGRPALAGPLLAGLSGAGQSAVTERAGHVREVLTGYRSGTAEVARPGEPRPDYDPARPLGGRPEAKARELGVSGRTIRRWVRAYRDGGEAGLADARRVSGRRLELDPRWEEACRTVVAGQVRASTPTAGALLRLIDAQLDDQYGPGAVPRPSTASAYRHLAGRRRAPTR